MYELKSRIKSITSKYTDMKLKVCKYVRSYVCIARL